MIELHDVTKVYRSPLGRVVHAVEGFSLRIERCEVVGLAGPNGAGKSTLLDLLPAGVPPWRAALVLAAYAALVYPVWAPGALLFVALYFLLFGGIGLLLSAVTRYDWMALGLVWALAQLLRSLFPADESWYGRVLDVSLPPLHVLSAMGGALVRGEAVPPFSYVWVTAYGSAALLLGLIIVRRRPLAS